MSDSSHKYKAVVFDLDGTAVPNGPEGMPSARLIKAVSEARSHMHLIAATGRPAKYAEPVFKALGLTDPCIISGGTVILDPVTARIIRRTLIPHDTVNTIVSILEKYPYELGLSGHGEGSGDSGDEASRDNIDIIYMGKVSAQDSLSMKQQIDLLPDVAFNTAPSWGGSGFVVHVTHQNATKEQSIHQVLSSLGVSKSEAVGVGDGDNDLHLFASVGLKVAMGNAGPNLKKAADLVAPSIDEDGLAEIIERFS